MSPFLSGNPGLYPGPLASAQDTCLYCDATGYAEPDGAKQLRSINVHSHQPTRGSHGRTEASGQRDLHAGRPELFHRTRPAALRARLVLVGARCGRGDLRPLLRLELRYRRRRLRRHVRRRRDHHDHVLGPHLQHRRDVARAAAHGRRLFLRTQRHGTVGRLRHRPRRKHRVRADARGHRLLHRLVPDGDLRDPGQHAAAVLARLLRRVPGAQPAGRGTVVQGVPDRDARRAGGAGDLLGERDSVLRLRALGAQHRGRSRRQGRRVARGWRFVPALRLVRCVRRVALRRVAVPRDRAAAAGGRGDARSAPGHAEGADHGHDARW